MNGRVLNGWKEIAQYLGRGVRTAQRWEQELALPVRRPRGKEHSAVIAFDVELDRWLAKAPNHAFEHSSDPLALITDEGPLPLRVLLVEDEIGDVYECVALLRRARVTQLEVVGTVAGALRKLEDVVEGKLLRPDVIVLDLNFAAESGFDVLRYWRTLPALRSIRMIVWTGMGEAERKLSGLFGAHSIVSKSSGLSELEAALRGTVQPLTPPYETQQSA